MATVESAVESSSSQSTLEDDMETQPTQPEESSSQTPNLRRAQPGIQIATKQDRPDEHAQATAEARSTRERQQAINGTDATRTGAVSRSPARTPSTPSPLLSRNMAGQKRMASGSLKRPSLAAAASTNPAATSPDPASPSRISKLSAQLSARLSYALVKVQHGWESRSLDEVEVLAEQQKVRSPATRSSHALATGSSQARMASLSRESSGPSDTRSLRSSQPSDQEARSFSGLAEEAALSPSRPRTQTYEAFWRDHDSTSRAVSQILKAQRTVAASTGSGLGLASLAGPTRLAPSAPIVSAAAARHLRRRKAAGSARAYPPALPDIRTTNGARTASTASAVSSAVSTTFPATPPPRSAASSRATEQLRTPGPRTPSEKAAMEQDAVETLLFMSSPAHSHHSKRPAAPNHGGHLTPAIYSPPPTSRTTVTRENGASTAAPSAGSSWGRAQESSARHTALRRVILDPSPPNDDSDEDGDGDDGSPARCYRVNGKERLGGATMTTLPTRPSTEQQQSQFDGDAEDEIDKLLDAMSSSSSDEDMMLDENIAIVDQHARVVSRDGRDGRDGRVGGGRGQGQARESGVGASESTNHHRHDRRRLSVNGL